MNNTNKPSKTEEEISQFITDIINDFVVLYGIGCSVWVKSLVNHRFPIAWSLTAGFGWFSYWCIHDGNHLRLLYYLSPSIFTRERLEAIWQHPTYYHYAVIAVLLSMPTLFLLGYAANHTRVKYQKLFKRAGLTNGLGDTPKLIGKRRLPNRRQKLVFDANGVPLSSFQNKSQEMATCFNRVVESIKIGKSQDRIELVLSRTGMPESISYSDIQKAMPLKNASFYLGESVSGAESQCISELPHMLIAGTTGGGKSIFFKQAILGIMESSPHLQVYAIDLKGGLEMMDFAQAPNVTVIKEVASAVAILRRIKKEMDRRFEHLSSSKRKKIDPKLDKLDRILVAIDEASVLYMNRPKSDPDHELAIEARSLADSIAKLSRAAAIHLILATQKLDRQVLPTSVTENISGRMAFRANSLQGSMLVLGNKAAWELPEIPGRGIWSFGQTQMQIQAPFISEEEIHQRCAAIANEYATGQRKNHGDQINLHQKGVTTARKNDSYGSLDIRSQSEKGNPDGSR